MSEKEYTNLKIAFASNAIEGFPSGALAQRNAERVLNGEISLSDLLAEIASGGKGQ